MDWDHLGEVVTDECKLLGLSAAALGRRAGFSDHTARMILRGEARPNRDTRARLESALLWQAGSVDLVLERKAPRRKTDPDLARIEHAWRDLPPKMRRIAADVVEALGG